jgi:hypothetical protein
MKNNSLRLTSGVKVTYHGVYTFRHPDEKVIKDQLYKIHKAGIKHRLNPDVTHCLAKGCLKNTKMYIPIQNGEKLISLMVYEEESLGKIQELIQQEMPSDPQISELSVRLTTEVEATYHGVFTFRHRDEKVIKDLLCKIRRTDIKHRLNPNMTHCLERGCLKNTKMHIPVKNGKQLVSIMVYEKHSLEKIRELLLQEVSPELREQILKEMSSDPQEQNPKTDV